MKQTSFASAEYASKMRQTRRERFLGEMNVVVPWARPEAMIEPHYPKSGKVGRPFVQRNKTHAADAQAIWTAGQQPGAKFVAVKNDAPQVVLSLHRLRAQLMKMRIMQTNELRGLLYEFGFVLPEGHRALLKELPATLLEAEVRLPAMLMDSLQEQLRRINDLEADLGKIERRLATQLRETPACKTLAEIPGVGLLTATAIVASMGSPSAFKDARQFAA